METNEPKAAKKQFGHLKLIHFIVLGVAFIALAGITAFFVLSSSSDDAGNQNTDAQEQFDPEEEVILGDVPESTLSDEEIAAGQLLDEEAEDYSLEGSRSKAEERVAQDPSLQNVTLLVSVCMEQKDLECLEQYLPTVSEQDAGLGNIMKEVMADIYAENGNTQKAIDLINEILTYLETNGVENNGDIDPKAYYQQKLESLQNGEGV